MATQNQTQDATAQEPVDAVPSRRASSSQVGPAGKKPRKPVPNPNPNMRRRGRPKAHSEDAQLLIKQQGEALEYRKMGLSYEQIGQKMGVNHQTAWNYVEAALKKVNHENAKEVKKMELSRLDAMFIKVYGDALRGDLGALASALKIMERRAKLLGIDAAIKTDNKTELSTADGILVIPGVMTPEEWMAAAAKQQTALTAENTANAAT